jgi:hypothetical protein
VLCDEHGIGGSGKYFGDNDAHVDIINVFYHEASGGKYAPRGVLFVLKPGVIDAVRASPLGCLFRPGNLVGKTGPKTTTKELSTNSSNPSPMFSSLHLCSLLVLARVQRTRLHFHPQHWPLRHLGLYQIEFFSGFLSKLRAPHRSTLLGPFVCGARAFSLTLDLQTSVTIAPPLRSSE